MVSVARQTVSAVVSVLSGKGTGKNKKPSTVSAAALDRVGGHGMQQLCAVAAFPMAPVPVSNNIFSTMAVIAAMVWIFESYGQSSARKDNLPKPDMALGIFAAVQTLSGLACAFAEQWGKPWVRLINGLVPNLVYCEGSIEVVILGLIFFYLGKSHRKLCLGYGIYCAAQFLSSVIMAAEYGRMSYVVLYFYQWMMIGSLPLMLCYNGQRGRQNGRVFYLFYPLHIWALYLLSNLLA